MQEPILITGAARSGTSMAAGVLNLCGAFGGKMYGAHKANPKGMFENTGIREQIVKPYLRQIGADPTCQYPLPDVNSLSIPVDWRERIEQTIQDQGYEEGIWFLKEPKMPSLAGMALCVPERSLDYCSEKNSGHYTELYEDRIHERLCQGK